MPDGHKFSLALPAFVAGSEANMAKFYQFHDSGSAVHFVHV